MEGKINTQENQPSTRRTLRAIFCAVGLMQFGPLILSPLKEIAISGTMAFLAIEVAISERFAILSNWAWIFLQTFFVILFALLVAPAQPLSKSYHFLKWLVSAIVFGVLTGFASSILLAFIQRFMGKDFGASTMKHDIWASGRLDYLLLSLVIVTLLSGSILEEYVFRNLLFHWLGPVRVFSSAVISLLSWAFLHGINGQIGHVLVIIPSGIVYVVLRIISKSWKISAAAHASANLTALWIDVFLA